MVFVYFGIVAALMEHLHVFRIFTDIGRQFFRIILFFEVIIRTLSIDGHTGLPFGEIGFQYLGQCSLGQTKSVVEIGIVDDANGVISIADKLCASFNKWRMLSFELGKKNM